ncbi:hypothetical protein [Sessilibacter corallicola]|uniref:hypothetical protein n=1 Tax=Sessilibacter corallicola TaxID=2904075 RepID=UPI001E469C74|nr:hypothetical protein [Sessilibacter corallicola]MCE2029472.1 hypothetical protein [Sessilibacter corallicola]
MTIKLFHADIFQNQDEGIVLTVDGAARGMEGNIARSFARVYPDIWEEVDEEISYPIVLGRAQAIKIHSDYDFHNKYCFIAATLNHIDTLSDREKLDVQSSALRHVLSLAESRRLNSIATTIMVGGWRLELEDALVNMVKVIQRANELSSQVPDVSVYVLSEQEFLMAHELLTRYL